jgi:MscS family membrane protein
MTFMKWIKIILSASCLFIFIVGTVSAQQEHPLKPLDTSSPRALINDFYKTLNQVHKDAMTLSTNYLESTRLYPSQQEKLRIISMYQRLDLVSRSLDLSETPQALGQETARILTLQLKSILDRIELPLDENIPDAQAMKFSEFKFWTIPDSEIKIALIQEGPRAGEYLFTVETVERLDEFYNKINHLPYQQENSTPDWYETHKNSGGGLVYLVPYRWFLGLPSWATKTVFEQPVWRWIGFVLIMTLSIIVLFIIHKAFIFIAKKAVHEDNHPFLSRLGWIIGFFIIIPFLNNFIGSNLRITGQTYEVLSISLWSIYYLSLSYGIWIGGIVIADQILLSRDSISGSIDSQLFRLATRLVLLILSFAILITGAQSMGIPAYSIVAGLGVSGIAVALAAQDSLANLVGSLIIMFEKPFRVGHFIKADDVEGTVESIGFRSTRIRTFYNSITSIPSKNLMNSTIDNMELRQYRRVKTFVNIDYDTPKDKIENFISGIKEIIKTNEYTRKDFYQVALNDYGEYCLKILVNFFLEVPDWDTELIEREKILMEVLQLAEKEGIKFSFPTESLHIKNLSDAR